MEMGKLLLLNDSNWCNRVKNWRDKEHNWGQMKKICTWLHFLLWFQYTAAGIVENGKDNREYENYDNMHNTIPVIVIISLLDP